MLPHSPFSSRKTKTPALSLPPHPQSQAPNHGLPQVENSLASRLVLEPGSIEVFRNGCLSHFCGSPLVGLRRRSFEQGRAPLRTRWLESATSYRHRGPYPTLHPHRHSCASGAHSSDPADRLTWMWTRLPTMTSKSEWPPSSPW